MDFRIDKHKFDLTFVGQEEVDTVVTAARIAAQECYPSYVIRPLLYDNLPNVLVGVQVSIERFVADQRGRTNFLNLEQDAMRASRSGSSEAWLKLGDGSALTATRALGRLSRHEPDTAEPWHAPDLSAPIARAQRMFNKINKAYLDQGLKLEPGWLDGILKR